MSYEAWRISFQSAEQAARAAYAEAERLRIGFDRYETARRMNPRQWGDAWKLNISTGKPFDEIIDDLKPFMRPTATKVSGNNG